MNVAVLSSHTPSFFWFRMDMMRDFIAKGYTVYAIGNEPEERWSHKFSENNIVYKQAHISRNGINPLSDVKTFLSLRKILKEIKPDKIFAYQAKTVIYGSLAAASLRIKEIYSLIAGCGSVFISQKFLSKFLRVVMKIEYRAALKYNKKVFFQNMDDVLLFSSLKIIPKEKTVIINGSGVDVEKFAVKPLPDNFTFLSICRLIKDKGIVEYLEAARIVKEQFPEVKFMLVGPFDTNASSLTYDELDVYLKDNVVEYHGEQSDVIPFIEQSSVFVLPSYREGTPKTVLEAMSCGRTIITTDVPGCKETVVNGINGLLVPVKDVSSLVNAMIHLIKNPKKLISMGKHSRQIAMDKFDVRKVNNSIMKTMGII